MSRKNREASSIDSLSTANDGPEPDEDTGEGEGTSQEKSSTDDLPRQGEQKLYPCTAGTQNAIINNKRLDMGAEIEGGMTRSQIYEHRRRGVPIHCPDLDNV